MWTVGTAIDTNTDIIIYLIIFTFQKAFSLLSSNPRVNPVLYEPYFDWKSCKFTINAKIVPNIEHLQLLRRRPQYLRE